MIIDFTIRNFRSIKQEQLLSMYVEHPKSHLASNVAYPLGDKLGVLRSVGIYGANASGKSNILLAFQALRYLTFQANLKEDESIPCYEPYRLSEQTKNAPIRFDIEFIANGLRYNYVIAFTRKEIVEEVLDVYPSRQKANIFRRTKDDTWESISFGSSYKGRVKRIPFFKNASYILSAGNNAASSDIVRNVYNFFGRTLTYMGAKDEIYRTEFLDDERLMSIAAKFLCNVDTGIVDIKKRAYEIDEDSKFLSELPVTVRKEVIERSKRMFEFSHKTESGEFEFFPQMLESEGTQKLFSLLPLLVKAFEYGNVLVIDELDNSFHSHIAELLIRLFNDPKVNVNNAQLLFSTHNLHLMSSAKMRRDQTWFTQKSSGETVLYSLDDFDKSKVKSNSPYDTWYDEGRFGALPQINYSSLVSLISSTIKPIGKEEVGSDRIILVQEAGNA